MALQKHQLRTGKVRLSYVNLAKPRAIDEDSAPTYSVTLLIPQSDKETYNKIMAAKEAAIQNWLDRNPGKKLPKDIKFTLHDGNGSRQDGDDYGDECKDCWVMTVRTKQKPTIVDEKRRPLETEEEIADKLYSGCYGAVILSLFVYKVSGNTGVSAGLNGVQFLEDGEPLGGTFKVSDDDWGDDGEDDDFL